MELATAAMPSSPETDIFSPAPLPGNRLRQFVDQDCHEAPGRSYVTALQQQKPMLILSVYAQASSPDRSQWQ